MSEHRENDPGSENPSTLPGGATGSLHTPVSNEAVGEAMAEAEAPLFDLVAESFEGEASFGELESLPGFDPLHALTEGLPPMILTAEDMELCECVPEKVQIETVCDRDDRVEVVNTTVAPWRWLCQLIITFPNNARSRCTGWFIGPKTVMSAGHCVYSKANGGWARQIEVIPGMKGSIRPFGSMVGTVFRSVTGWTQKQDQNFDYGCIILPNDSLGRLVGWFGFAALTDASLNNLLINNSGYPGDKPFGTQWFNAGRVTKITNRKIYYMIDTFGGQSGSPTWRTVAGQRQAVGIHAYGGCPNSSTRINTEVYNNMMTWRNS